MTDREQLGQQIAKKFRAVRRVNQTRYSVKSQSVKGKYDIYKTDIGWTCCAKIISFVALSVSISSR